MQRAVNGGCARQDGVAAPSDQPSAAGVGPGAPATPGGPPRRPCAHGADRGDLPGVGGEREAV